MSDPQSPNGSLRRGSVSMPLALAQSVGIQGPTAGVIVGPAFIASIVGEPGALAQLVGLVTMGFVAYAFVRFTRRFNTAGSVYAFNGVAVGPGYGLVSAWLLLLVYLGFAAGVYAATAEIAQSLLATAGVNLAWQLLALVLAGLALVVAATGISPSSTAVLVLEASSIVLISVVAVKVIADGGYHHHGLSAGPFTLHGVGLSVLALGVVQVFGQFSGFEGAATLGEETRRAQRAIPAAVAISLMLSAAVYIFFTWISYSAYPSAASLAADPAPLVHIADSYLSHRVGVVVNAAGVLSGFGALVALLNAAARLVFALAGELGLRAATRTTTGAQTPLPALLAVAVASVGGLLAFTFEPTPARAASLLIQYAAYLLLAAYAMTLVAALVSAWRQDRRPFPLVLLGVGIAVIGYVLYRTFVPLPAAPFDRLVVAAGVSLVIGVAALALPGVRRSLRDSTLLSRLRGP